LVRHESQLFAAERERQRRKLYRKELREKRGNLTKIKRPAYSRTRTPRRAARPTFARSAGSGGDSGDGSGDSDQGDPPRPRHSLTPSHPAHTKSHSTGRADCWRLPRNTCGTRHEGRLAA
jgi:hypothetical protein